MTRDRSSRRDVLLPPHNPLPGDRRRRTRQLVMRVVATAVVMTAVVVGVLIFWTR